MFRSEWREFGALPCRIKKLDDSSRLDLLKSRASLTRFRVRFLPGRAKDLSASRCDIYADTSLFKESVS